MFTVNKQILEAHRYKIYQEILEAVRLVKDELNQVGQGFNFDINRSLLNEVKLSCSRYKADRTEGKAPAEKGPVSKEKTA